MAELLAENTENINSWQPNANGREFEIIFSFLTKDKINNILITNS